MALLNILGKALKKIIIKYFLELIERYLILPITYIGGRKGILID